MYWVKAAAENAAWVVLSFAVAILFVVLAITGVSWFYAVLAIFWVALGVFRGWLLRDTFKHAREFDVDTLAAHTLKVNSTKLSTWLDDLKDGHK